MKKILPLLIGCLFSVTGIAQEQQISLSMLYDKLEQNYPTADKMRIRNEITGIQQQLSQTGWYPEVTVGASTSWQSEVTEVPFVPNGPEFSQDHYTVSLDIVQPVFEAGRVSKMKRLNQIQGEVANASTEVEMQSLRRQIDQIYFGILQGRKNLEILQVLTHDLEEQLSSIESRVNNGVLLPGNKYSLEAELLKVEQQKTGVEEQIKGGFEMLSILSGAELNDRVELEIPETSGLNEENEFYRAEYELFDARQQILNSQLELSGSDKLPVITAFGKTAYGRPGFNAFDNDLHFYWMVGLKAQWSFRSWRNSDKKAQVLELEKDELQTSEDAFTRQLKAGISKQQYRIESLNKQIELDGQVLELRTKVVAEKKHQLNEGVITSTEFITELNAENRARLNLELHKIQLMQAKYEYQTLKGDIWK